MKPIIVVLFALASVSVSAATLRKQFPPPPSAQVAPVTDPNLTDAQIRSRVRTYLGAIDTVIPADRWRALGPRAETPLLEVAGGAVLPTRRAKAFDALSLVGSTHFELFTKVIGNESEPFVVRYAAMRSFSTLQPAATTIAQLTPILTASKDVRVRAAAGAVLAFTAPKAACDSVRAQIGREAKADRGQYARAMDVCFMQ